MTVRREAEENIGEIIALNKTEVMETVCGWWRGSGLYDSLDEWHLYPVLKWTKRWWYQWKKEGVSSNQVMQTLEIFVQ